MSISTKKNILLPASLMCLFFLFPIPFSQAQGDVITNVRTAIKSGSSKELSQYFGTMVVLNFDGEKSSYSKSQAEFVIKDFFKKHEPVDVEYIHQGDSKKGFKYIMGKYRSETGSFRIYILFKKTNGSYYVDTMDFTRE